MIKPILKKLIVLLISILLLGIASLYILFETSLGLRAAIIFAKRYYPDLYIETVTGTISDFTFQNLRLTKDNIKIDIKEIQLEWKPLQLFSRKLYIQKLVTTDATFNILSNQATSNRSWINKVWLNDVTLNNTSVYQNNILKSSIKLIHITRIDENTNQFNIELNKGSAHGTFQFNDLIKRTWTINADANTIDTNSIWSGLPDILSFHLESSGEWNSNNKNLNLLINNISGNIRNNPINGIVDIKANDSQILINNLNINLGKTFFKLQGIIEKDWNLIWQINSPNINVIYKDASGSLTSAGTIILKNKIPYAQGTIRANSIRINNLSINRIDGTISSTIQSNAVSQLNFICNQISFKNSNIPNIQISSILNWHSDGYQSNSIITFSNANKLNASIKFFNSSALQGDINLQFNDISKIFTNRFINSMQGNINGNIKISGKISNPIFQGFLSLNNASFSIPKLGIHPRALNIRSVFNNNLLANIDGKFISGSGQGTLTGKIDLSKTNYPFQMKLRGNQLQVANTNRYKITATPNLDITMDGSKSSVVGDLLLPHVSIIAQQYLPVVTLPRELRFVGEETPTFNFFRNLAIRIRLRLGNYAHLEYQQLKANLGGDITITQIPGGLPSGNGVFLIKNGTYIIYDKEFRINKGRLEYVGNLLTDPGLNIIAIQQLHRQARNFLGFRMGSNQNIEVGIAVTGTLKNPVISLYSNPIMSQDDILSYMIFGQPRSSVNGANALSLLGTLTSQMNLQGPSLGSQSNATTGMLGIFKMGIFDPIQALNFNLPISRYIGIQTETSYTETGADVLFNYEPRDSYDNQMTLK